MDEQRLDRQEEEHAGGRAEELMLLIEPYLTRMDDNLILALRQIKPYDMASIQNIKLQLHALEALKTNIQSVINTGKLASAALNGDNNV